MAGTDPAGHCAPAGSRDGPPVFAVTLWPHRSLGVRGMRTVVAIAALGLSVPLVALRHASVMPFLVPFLLAVLLLIWAALRRNLRDGRLHEDVRLWPDALDVVRTEPNGRERRWSAHPHWVRVEITDTHRLASYLTLSGGGRTIELGAFLSAQERVALAAELRAALARVRGHGG